MLSIDFFFSPENETTQNCGKEITEILSRLFKISREKSLFHMLK